MAKSSYEIGSDLKLKETSGAKLVLQWIARVMIYALGLLVVLYLAFALLVNTDTERRLKRENRMYEKLYPELLPKQQLLGDAMEVLQVKDNAMYEDLFHAQAPSVDPINSLSFLYGSDTIPDTKLVSYTYAKAEALEKKAESVDVNFLRILVQAARKDVAMPPMELPVRDISYTQLGATKGDKYNPFYHAKVPHNGLDFIVAQGSPVYCSADGYVTVAEKSNKGMGNVVVITHDGGYQTKYAHLSTITVRQGQKISSGRQIGTVGMTGTAYAPHLHYEVLMNGVPMNPIGYIFASLSPEEYTNMLYVATNTDQSMD